MELGSGAKGSNSTKANSKVLTESDRSQTQMSGPNQTPKHLSDSKQTAEPKHPIKPDQLQSNPNQPATEPNLIMVVSDSVIGSASLSRSTSANCNC